MKMIINKKDKNEMKASMYCLSIELTRKCNMCCDFCSRGDAQDITITKEIIDKTLDEVQNIPLYEIRIHGGEPLLAPDMFCYLVDEIISRRIIVGSVLIFSNGTVKDETIREALKRLADYLVKTEKEFLEYFVEYFQKYISVYEKTEGKKVTLVISTYNHDNAAYVDNAIIYYNMIDNPYFMALSQDEARPDVKRDVVSFEGNAEKNYKKLIVNKTNLDNIRIIDNNYDFITEIDDTHIFIDKTLTVSANGNVFPGCLMSYKNVDKKPMFNILNCNGDFIDRIDTFCWQNPLYKSGNAFRCHYLALRWAKEHNIDVVNNRNTSLEGADHLNRYLVLYEKAVIELHKLVPLLNHTECKLMALAKMCLDILNDKKTKTNIFEKRVFIKNFITACFEVIDSDQIKYFTDEYWLRGFILDLSKINNKRKKATQ